MGSQAEEGVRKKERGREIEREKRENKRLGDTWDGDGKLETQVCV